MARRKSRRKSRGSRQQSSESSASQGIPIPDRRAMEGILQQVVSGLAGQTASDVDAAQQIMYEAFETESPRRQVALARQALETSPDCADAYVLLAEHAESLPEALQLYEQGVAAGERALGPQGFREYEGHFWGVLETRPYMRAREGLAGTLWAAGRREEAAEHCRQMLQLNPSDNQGIRYRLACMLLDLEQHDELEQLLQQYEEDATAEWAYTQALLAFRQEGDTERARQLLVNAETTNAHVPGYLTGARPIPRSTRDVFALGSDDEAVFYAMAHLPVWKNTPGATSWVRKTLKVSMPEPPKKRRVSQRGMNSLLGQLPLDENEIWEVDLRAVTAPLGGDQPPEKVWTLIVASATNGHPVALELLVDRPKDSEIWNRLIDAMRNPKEDEPHRPAEIHVARKTWFKAWEPKLRQVGIKCRLSDPLEHVDYILEEALSLPDMFQQIAGGFSTSDDDWPDIASFPQRAGDIWQADVRQLPMWVKAGGEPSRPWGLLVVDVENDLILATNIAHDEPKEDWLWQGLRQAICRPAAGEPHRPGVVQVASEAQRDALAARLEPAGIRCVASDHLEHVTRLFDELVEHLGEGQHRSALIDSPGVGPEELASLYSAAADFYVNRPWRKIPGDTIIEVACDKFDSSPWYAVVMGQSGVELGLALYEDLKLLRSILTGRFSDQETARRTSAISATFGEIFEIAPQDLDAAERYGWPIAGPEAYPVFMRVDPGMAVRAPLKRELELLEGCLRAIPEFLSGDANSGQVSVELASDSLTLQFNRLN